MRLEGKLALITGAATGVRGELMGIGGATAWLFSREGARLIIADINDGLGERTAADIRGSGGDATFVHLDVRSEESWQRAMEEVSRLGRLDILVNNAGTAGGDKIENTTVEEWDEQMAVHARGAFLGCKYAIPEIRERGGGAIINTASVQGLQSQKLVPAYAASKGGVLSLTRQMALDYASDNIRVLAVCPGTIDTQMVRESAAMEEGDPDEIIKAWGKGHPIGRVGTGLDIANVVLFLASDKASFMTGEYVSVDGGYMALGAWASGAGAAAAED